MWEYKATVTKVVDADTLDLIIDCGFGISKFERVRLARVDAWEVRGKEREQGLLASDFVKKLLNFNVNCVTVRTSKDKGKFGRYIAEVYLYVPDIELPQNLSDLLLKEGHAELY